jgi:RND family efflux transporter MFP subunit
MSRVAPRRRVDGRAWLWVLVVLAVVGVGAWFLLGRGGGAALPQVVAEAVERGAFRREVTGSGVVEAVDERALAFRTGGTVAEVLVEEGDTVAAGQPLLRLDTAELERTRASTAASLRSARADRARIAAQLEVDRLDLEASVAQAEDRLEQATTDLRDRTTAVARVERLLELGAASRDELQSAQDALDAAERAAAQADLALASARTRLANARSLAEAQLASADANVARLETDLANLDARLEDAVLSAPFDGVVAVLNASVGDAVGSQPVATVADPTRLRVRAAFDENRAGELAVDLPGDVVPDADTALRLPARVTRLSPVAAREGGGAQVEVLLDFLDDDAETRVRPGYTVTARVRVAEADDVLRIPLEALSEDEGGRAYLFLVEPLADDPDRATVRRVDVATIERNATVAAVDPATVSFGTDDRIAVVGIDDLQDGDEVRVASAGARAP